MPAAALGFGAGMLVFLSLVRWAALLLDARVQGGAVEPTCPDAGRDAKGGAARARARAGGLAAVSP